MADRTEAAKEAARKYYQRNREHLAAQKRKNQAAKDPLVRKQMILKHHLRKRFNISIEEFEQAIAKRGNVCDVCREPETRKFKGETTRLSVDHDHATGRIRGILCDGCNKAIGHMLDSPDRLRNAANYILSPPGL